jgi:tetratricopeptide (TPR) repeat protein
VTSSDGTPSDVSITDASAATGADLPALLQASEDALDSGRCIEGTTLARRAIEAAEELEDLAGQAAALRLLAKQLTLMGDFEETVRSCEKAAILLRDLDDQAGLCDILIIQALALNELSLSQEALDALAIARELASRLQDSGLLYWVLNRIAVVHAGMQDFRRSFQFQQRALPLSEGMDEDARFCILNNVSDTAIGLALQLREEGDPAAADQAITDGLGYADAAIAMRFPPPTTSRRCCCCRVWAWRPYPRWRSCWSRPRSSGSRPCR